MQRLPLLLCLLSGLSASADGLSQLHSFLSGTQTLTAEFSQTVSNKSGKKQQQASGTVHIQRPGKFNWHYTQPYEQKVIGDGQKLWMYDPDLNQVTVKKLDQALGNSPAALLAGSNDLERNYQLQNLASKDGVEWVEASPKARDNTFERVRMGFKDGQLYAMELSDNFGQQTSLKFSKAQKNGKLAAELFTFTPSKGADVVTAD